MISFCKKKKKTLCQPTCISSMTTGLAAPSIPSLTLTNLMTLPLVVPTNTTSCLPPSTVLT